MTKNILFFALILSFACTPEKKGLTEFVNPFLGTAPLTNPTEIGYTPPKDWRVWAGLTFPGSSLPNAMVQLSPITEWRSGAGYEYEDSEILGFTHTNKGHWNLCHIPFLPVTGEVNPADFASKFNHENETASPGYYQVFLERYGINTELTSTLRCGFHKYTFKNNEAQKLIVNLSRSNERVHNWELIQDGDFVFKGLQNTGSSVYFYAIANQKIKNIETLKEDRTEISVLDFDSSEDVLEIKIGLSFVSTENAKQNLDAEIGEKTFAEIRNEATQTWENLLSKIKVSGGTERETELFYSSLYRSFLWPALRSDVNGEFTDASGEVVKKDFRYYTNPSLWDTYRNKLVLLEMLAPDVTADVIQSLIDKGEKTGFMPTFFHGDHAAPFISGSYLRGIKNYDVKSAYQLLLNNATKEGGTRPHITEYIEKGYISTPDIENPHVETKAKAGVTKTLEYAYDDYSLAMLAKELGDSENYELLMKRTSNYKNLFNQPTGLMRGRLENGDWVKNFNPEYPYYEYMYREANAWQSTFFAPHDTKGLIALYENESAFEAKLDSMYVIPWNPNHIARNVSSFIGQYCQGNQPAHSFPWMYHFIDKPEKSQLVLDSIMNHFYGMGEYGLALCGMDDAGEMSAWYVFAAMGIYPYSPGDADYIISVPLFDKVEIEMDDTTNFTILKKNAGNKITGLNYNNKKITDFFISHDEMKKGNELVIETD